MRLATLSVAFVLAAMPAFADVTLKGAVAKPQSFSMADLAKLPQVSITVTQQTGKGPFTATFTGAALWPILNGAGFVNGPEKNSIIRHTIVVTSGTDGYQAALSEGELDPNLEGKSVLLAITRDGKPLDQIQLVVPGDAHASRSVHDVVTIDVR